MSNLNAIFRKCQYREHQMAVEVKVNLELDQKRGHHLSNIRNSLKQVLKNLISGVQGVFEEREGSDK